MFSLNPYSFTKQLAKSQDSTKKFITHLPTKTLFILLIRQSKSFSPEIDTFVSVYLLFIYICFNVSFACHTDVSLGLETQGQEEPGRLQSLGVAECLSKIHVKA